MAAGSRGAHVKSHVDPVTPTFQARSRSGLVEACGSCTEGEGGFCGPWPIIRGNVNPKTLNPELQLPIPAS